VPHVEYLDGRATVEMVFFRLIAFMCLMRDLLNNSSIDTNMDNYAEMILSILDKHDAAEAVNTLYEETAERINAEGPKKGDVQGSIVI